DRQPGALRVVAGYRERALRRVDTGHPGALGREGFGQDPAAATHIEHALAAEPVEHRAEILHPHGVQLVQSGERSGVAPPEARHALHQTLVLLGLGEAAEAGKLLGHGDKSTALWRLGEVWEVREVREVVAERGLGTAAT